MVSWIDDCEEIHSDDSIIDLGCGNGMMCIELVRYYIKPGIKGVLGIISVKFP